MIDFCELPLGWSLTSLGEFVISISYGFTASAIDRPVGPKFLRITDLQNNSVNWDTVPFCNCDQVDKYKLKKGDIVVARTGATTGKSFLLDNLPEPTVFASYLIRLHTSGLCPPEYLALFMQSIDYWRQITVVSKGTAQPGANASILSTLSIPVPPANEQKRIVAKIEALMARSQRVKEALEAIPTLLDQFRQSVLAAAFRGDLTADWREKNSDVEPASVLLERIRRVRRQHKAKNKELEEIDLAALPELPESWCWTILGEVSAIQGGIQKQPKRVPDKNAYPFLRVANVPRGWLNLDDVHRIELFGGELEKLRLYKGDLLIVEGNGSPSEIGRMAIWDGSIKDCVHQNHLIRVRLSQGLTPEFVEAYWNSPQGRFRVFDVAHTTTGLYTLSVSKIAKLPVPLAPEAEQVVLMQIMEKLFKIETYAQATITQSEEELDSLEQSILAKAFRLYRLCYAELPPRCQQIKQRNAKFSKFLKPYPRRLMSFNRLLIPSTAPLVVRWSKYPVISLNQRLIVPTLFSKFFPASASQSSILILPYDQVLAVSKIFLNVSFC